jgi:sugar phosphate isomerase/epimerase
MKISVSSYSFQQYITAGKMTQFDCVAKAKELGFDAIEFIDLEALDFESKKALALKLRAEANRVGIEINAYAIWANLFWKTPEESEREVERIKEQLEIAKMLGVGVMRHDICGGLGQSGASRSFDLMLPTIAKNALRITQYAKMLGIRTCIENHGFVAQDSDRIERLFNAVADDNFGVLIDIGNFLCVDENPITAVSRLAPYAIHVHLKDFKYTTASDLEKKIFTRGANYIKPTTVGTGDVPVKQCLAILKRAGYDNYISLEYEGSEDCVQEISLGLKNIKEYLSQI